MPGALTRTRITWAFSPMALQVPGITLGCPLCPWFCGHSSWRGARHLLLTNNNEMRDNRIKIGQSVDHVVNQKNIHNKVL